MSELIEKIGGVNPCLPDPLALMTDVGGSRNLGDVKENCAHVVIAIDFGTAYSGIAFSLQADPIRVKSGAPTASNPSVVKVPTVLLELLPDGVCNPGSESVWMFGCDAQQRYNQLLETDQICRPPFNYFQRYKMTLNGKNSGFDTISARSTFGNEHSLMDLIIRTLEYLKDFALAQAADTFGRKLYIDRNYTGRNDVEWVLTVPAIWNDFGKAFMRRAAFRAGLIASEHAENLSFALEPEAASLSIQACSNETEFQKGHRFIVVDGGGGTVDITTHEVVRAEPYLQLKSIAAPTGGPWGGDYVDENFRTFLRNLLGEGSLDATSDHALVCEIMEQFRTVKFFFNPEKDSKDIRLMDILNNPKDLVKYASDYNDLHPEAKVVITPKTRNGFLTMSKELMLSFYEPLLRPTVDKVATLLRSVPGISSVIVVGGFCKSEVLRQRILREFHQRNGVQVKLLSKPDPQGAIVHGAVYHGLYANIIQSRVAGYTYGVDVARDGVPNAFHRLVQRGQSLEYNHRAELLGRPQTATSTALVWTLYRTEDPDPKTVEGAQELGKLVVQFPMNIAPEQRVQKAIFRFGGSEIKVTVVDVHRQRTVGAIQME